MTNEQIKINRVDLHTSCPIAQRIEDLEEYLENKDELIASLYADVEDKEELIENLRLDLKDLEEDLETSYHEGSTIECFDCKDLRAALKAEKDYSFSKNKELNDLQHLMASTVVDKDELIAALHKALKAARDENNRLNDENLKLQKEIDREDIELDETLEKLYYSRLRVEELGREVDELREAVDAHHGLNYRRDRQLSDIKVSLTEILKGIGE